MPDLYLFRSALQDLMRPRRILSAALLVLVPLAFALVWRSVAGHHFHARPVYDDLANRIVFSFSLVLLSLLFGSGVVSEEIDQKTIVYLLTRPVPRWRILIAKFLAAWVGITVALWASAVFLALGCFGPGGLGHPPLGQDLLVLPVGALAYGALFLMLATLIRRPLFLGLLLAFGWESWIPNLPGSVLRASLISYIRALTPHPTIESDTVDITHLLNAVQHAPIPRITAWCVLGACSVLCLAVALTVFSRAEFVPREED